MVRRAACVLAALILCTPLGIVSAHSEVVFTEPRPSDVVARAVNSVTVAFNEEVTLPRVVIRNSAGQIVAGRLQRGTSRDRVVFRPSRALRNGSYLVQWRVRSADGHWVSGSWRFRVARAPA